MDLKRLLNKLHPYAPKRWENSAADLIEQCPPGKQPIGQLTIIEQPRSVALDTGKMTPVSGQDYILNIDKKENTRVEFGPLILFKLYNARVVGPDADIISCENCALPEFTPQNGGAGQHSVFYRRRFSRAKKLSGVTLNLVTPHSKNYYHWLLQALPNLRACGLHEVDQILIPRASRFHRQTLEFLGVTEKSIIELQAGKVFQCDQLLTCNYQQSISPAPGAVEWVKKTIGQQVASAGKEKKFGATDYDRIYISRADSQWRTISNEDEVIRFLSAYGFHAVTLSTLEFIEQVRLFGRASHIIAAHGAGMANLAFAKPGTKVLEIFPPRWTSLCFAHLSQLTGCHYHFMIAQPLGLTAEHLLDDEKHIPADNRSQGATLTIPMDKIALYAASELNRSNSA